MFPGAACALGIGHGYWLRVPVTPRMAEGVVEIARVVGGGREALRRRPVISAFQCSLSPLAYEEGALEAAKIYAEAGIPCGFVVMPISCATAPATAGGLLVQSNAEVLAGIVAQQLLVPGAATFYGSCATAMDLRSGAAACGGPEDLLLQMASAQLARRYGVPSIIGTFATGAKVADWQAGLENGLSAMSSCLAGADLLCGAGLLFGARVALEGCKMPPPGGYKLKIRANGQTAISIDGEPYEGAAKVSAGTHSFEMEWTRISDPPRLEILWSLPGKMAQLIPRDAFSPPGAKDELSNGLH